MRVCCSGEKGVDARVRAGELAIHEILERLEQRRVDWIAGAELAALDPEGHSFFNVNTPDDLARADAIVAASGGLGP